MPVTERAKTATSLSVYLSPALSLSLIHPLTQASIPQQTSSDLNDISHITGRYSTPSQLRNVFVAEFIEKTKRNQKKGYNSITITKFFTNLRKPFLDHIRNVPKQQVERFG